MWVLYRINWLRFVENRLQHFVPCTSVTLQNLQQCNCNVDSNGSIIFSGPKGVAPIVYGSVLSHLIFHRSHR